MVPDTRASWRLIVRAATAALLSFAPLLPANAQFWGDSWGGRQQQPQRPYNPYGGFGGDRGWDYWDYRQRERPPSYHQRGEQRRERSREVEKDNPLITPTRRQPRRARMPRSRSW